MPTPNEILAELKKVKYPGFTRDIVSFGMVKDIEVAYAGVTVIADRASRQARSRRRRSSTTSKRTVAAMPGVPAVKVQIEQAAQRANDGRRGWRSRRLIAGRQAHRRGGQRQGRRRQIDGRGEPGARDAGARMAHRPDGRRRLRAERRDDGRGRAARSTLTPERRIIPLESFGIRYISMALFINDETAVIWRGPMVTKLETEFLFNVEWGELDCLVLDLPPGTGDAQLTITQRVALARRRRSSPRRRRSRCSTCGAASRCSRK